MILNKIIEHKKIELKESVNKFPLIELQSRVKDQQPPKDFYKLAKENSDLKIIAEVKRASPSKGIICEDFNPVQIAKSYESNGAFAISVLTDKQFFMGELEYLLSIKKEVGIPLLRKDFTLDPYHVYEARYYGADIVLLIVSVLEKTQISDLLDITSSLDMSAIVEVHDKNELEVALDVGSKIIGINNRNLKTFEVNLSTTEKLSRLIPEECLVISESGIKTAEDINRLESLGINTFLIGESFMSYNDPGFKLKELISNVSSY